MTRLRAYSCSSGGWLAIFSKQVSQRRVKFCWCAGANPGGVTSGGAERSSCCSPVSSTAGASAMIGDSESSACGCAGAGGGVCSRAGAGGELSGLGARGGVLGAGASAGSSMRTLGWFSTQAWSHTVEGPLEGPRSADGPSLEMKEEADGRPVATTHWSRPSPSP